MKTQIFGKVVKGKKWGIVTDSDLSKFLNQSVVCEVKTFESKTDAQNKTFHALLEIYASCESDVEHFIDCFESLKYHYKVKAGLVAYRAFISDKGEIELIPFNRIDEVRNYTLLGCKDIPSSFTHATKEQANNMITWLISDFFNAGYNMDANNKYVKKFLDMINHFNEEQMKWWADYSERLGIF